jgi:hypothetical protein
MLLEFGKFRDGGSVSIDVPDGRFFFIANGFGEKDYPTIWNKVRHMKDARQSTLLELLSLYVLLHTVDDSYETDRTHIIEIVIEVISRTSLPVVEDTPDIINDPYIPIELDPGNYTCTPIASFNFFNQS